jgi:multiple sugar transport system ATP-binding protein
LASVKLKGVTKRFGRSVAVDDVSIDVEDGSFMVLLGPSGCGKTTTLRCIAGSEEPDDGEIFIGDRLVNNLPPKDRDVAMVFQSYALYPHMKVFDNIAFPLRMHKLAKGEIEKRVRSTAELLQISHLLDRKPRQISGGEAQRVALGRAIVRNPKVFLMDEPLSNLDAKLRIHMRVELKRLQKDLGTTTIYVTHDQLEAMSMADEIAIMNKSKLQQVGNARDIFNYPRNLFVAGFIGSPPMNFIDCTFKEKEKSCFLESSAFTLPIPSDICETAKEGMTSSELVLGVRPEDFRLGNGHESRGSIKGTVFMIEVLGSEVIVDVKVGNDLIKVKTLSDFRKDLGEEIWISFDQRKMYLFDKKTEKAIV